MSSASYAVRLDGIQRSDPDSYLARFGYNPEDIVTLTDDTQNPRQIPTKQNMVSDRIL